MFVIQFDILICRGQYYWFAEVRWALRTLWIYLDVLICGFVVLVCSLVLTIGDCCAVVFALVVSGFCYCCIYVDDGV